MSDPSRKSFTERARENIIPDHHKSVGERIKESVTDTVDRVKAAFTPHEAKGLPQQAADKLTHHDNSHVAYGSTRQTPTGTNH
jgi:hypothetical protein